MVYIWNNINCYSVCNMFFWNSDDFKAWNLNRDLVPDVTFETSKKMKNLRKIRNQ